MEYNAYVYGDVVMLTRILSQVAMIFDGSAFVVAMKVAALTGIILALWIGIVRGGQLSASTFFWPLIIPVLLITPRVDLVIEDTSGGMSRVDDLPVGFAAPVSIITTIGAGVSNMLTENLGLDSNLVSMDNGHLISLRAPMVYEQILTNPAFAGTASQFSTGLSPSKDTLKYVQTCLVWDAKSSTATDKMHQLQNRSLANLRVGSSGMTVGASNGQVYECGALYDALMAGFRSTDFQGKMNASVNEFFAKSMNDTRTGSRYQTAMEAQNIDLGDFYALASFSNALQMAPNYVTQAAGGGSHEAALQDALNQKRERNFGTAAMIFETISHTISFTEAWSFSLVPLVLLLLMLGPIGAKTGARYFWMLVWIQLWYPTILLTISYLDAWMDGAAIGSFGSIGRYNAFMAELMRVQDVGYMNLSMATGLSMMLVFGTSSALGAAMQRDMTGADHYDPKKNAPDTLSRAPHYSYGSAFNHTDAGGYVGTGAKEAFAGMTFAYDTSRAEGISYGDLQSIASGSQVSASTGTTNSRGHTDNTSSTTALSASERTATGRNTSSGLSFGTGVTRGGSVGNSSGQMENFTGMQTVGVSGSGNVGFGVGGAGGANAGIAAGATTSSSASHTAVDSSARNTGFNLGTEQTARSSDSSTASKSEEVADTKTDSRQDASSYHLGSELTESGNVGTSASRTDTTTENQSSSSSTSKSAQRHYDAITVSNGIARNGATMQMMNELIASSPEVTAAVNDFMNQNDDKLRQTFAGENAEDAKKAMAGMYVMQGMYSGNLFPNDPNGGERMEALNALSDEIMFRTGFGRPGEGSGAVDASALKSMNAPTAEEVNAAAGGRIVKYGLTEDAARSAADRTPLSPDGEETFGRFMNEVGMDVGKLTKGQMNGLFSAFRDRLDANRAQMEGDTESFMSMYKDLGLRDALKNNFWLSDAMSLRRDAVYDSYDDAKGTVPEASGPEMMEANGNAMLDHRLGAFKEAGIDTSEGSVARFMALTQLEAGAIERGEMADAGVFSAMKAGMQSADPVLGNLETSSRVEAFALTGASPEAVFTAHTNAQNEYMLGGAMLAAEQKSGFDIRSDGEGISWENAVRTPANLEVGEVGEHHRPITISAHDRDIAIRTVIGEAAGESELGQAAVAHVIRTRFESGNYGSSVADVSLARKQFSAWNSGAGGNHLVQKYGPGDAKYEAVGAVVDAVFNGSAKDPTSGATHYYSPAGMRKLVADGDQKNEEPTWLEAKSAESGGTTKIGGHIFVGRG